MSKKPANLISRIFKTAFFFFTGSCILSVSLYSIYLAIFKGAFLTGVYIMFLCFFALFLPSLLSFKIPYSVASFFVLLGFFIGLAGNRIEPGENKLIVVFFGIFLFLGGIFLALSRAFESDSKG